MNTRHTSPFDTLEATFRLVASGPQPLSLDTTALTVGGPARRIPLLELRDWLLHPSTPLRWRDAAVSAVAVRGRDGGGAWMVGIGGLLLPGLRRGALGLVTAWPQGRDDIESHVLLALVEAVAGFEDDRPHAAGRLVWPSVRAARTFVRRERARAARESDGTYDHTPVGAAEGHPDFLIGAAVDEGAISAQEAALIGETRLEKVDLRALAGELGVTYAALHQRRRRAEQRLVVWLSDRMAEGMSKSGDELAFTGCGPIPLEG